MKSNKSPFALLALLLLLLTPSAWVRAQQDIVIYNSGYFLSFNSSSNAVSMTTTFDPATCIWVYNGGSIKPFSDANRYLAVSTSSLYTYNYTTSTNSNTAWTMTENALYYHSRNSTYYYYNNGTTKQNSRGTSAPSFTNVRGYSVSHSDEVAGSSVQTGEPTLSIAPATASVNYQSSTTFTATSSRNTVTTTTITPESYTFNGITYYKQADDTWSTINPGSYDRETTTSEYPTSYTWSIESGASAYATFSFSENTATISYTNNYTANSSYTVTATAQYAGGAEVAGTATVTLLTPTVETPVITVGADGTITMTCATVGATIYYTQDGTTPTTSSTQYTAPFTLTGTNIINLKAIAVRTDWNNSLVAEARYPVSGINDGIARLVDLQDHNWTLYTGVNSDVDDGHYNSTYEGKIYFPYPKDVTITYYGNGYRKDVSTYSEVSGVKVGIDADCHTFVYYKTLESGNGYKYRTIPNPFSVRPKNSTTYYGFSYWRVKSITGGSITGVSGVGATMSADVEYTFNPDSEYGMILELEAIWEPAEVSTNGSFSNGYNSVERNIYVVQSGNFSAISTPCTYTSIYPNGTTDGTTPATGATLTRTSAFTASADCKIEYINFSMSSNGISGDGKNFTIGRGVSTSNVCANVIYGCDKNITNPNFHTRIESGKYNYMSYLGGYYSSTGNSTGTERTITVDNAANTSVRITMGSDYDRAVGADDKLIVKYSMTMAKGSSISEANKANDHFLFVNVKSGKLGSTQFMSNLTNNSSLAARQGGAGYGNYMSSASSQTYVGCRSILIEGGQLSTVGSGIDLYTRSTNSSGSSPYNLDFVSFRFRMTGGTVHGNVYGGAAKSPAGGNRQMIVTGGTIEGWFAAGCNGTDDAGGQTYGESFVYIGGNGKVNSNNNGLELGYCNGGNVFAAGAGRQGTTTCGEMSVGTNLAIADNCEVERGIYGGGNYGYAESNTHSYIYITGGTNLGRDDVYGSATSKGAVFGGANQQNGPEIKIYMTGGEMRGGVYGGSNTTGTISSNTTIKILGGQVGTDANNTARVCGGGLGSSTRVTNNVDVTIGGDATIYGEVYGGSEQGLVNTANNSDSYQSGKHVNVNVTGGTINGAVYGGGLGTSSNAANTYGVTKVTVTGGTVNGSVFGCNNVNGMPYDKDVEVEMTGGTVTNVYGGGNQAAYTGSTSVIIGGHATNTATVTGNVYGGGFGTTAVLQKSGGNYGETDVKVKRNAVVQGNVYGGGNGAAVEGNTNVTIGE